MDMGSGVGVANTMLTPPSKRATSAAGLKMSSASNNSSPRDRQAVFQIRQAVEASQERGFAASGRDR
jgi:hypothetical protein